MKLALSWDDGALEDRRLFDLHEKYQIHGMFFVPTRNKEGRSVLTPDMLKNAESDYVSFGGHTENHVYLTGIPPEQVDGEVFRNKQYLEDTLGHEVIHFCLPGGKYNETILKTAFRHYQTVRTADTMSFRYNGNLLKPSIHVFPRGSKSLLGNAARNLSIPQLLYIALHLKKDYFSLIHDLLERERKKDGSTVVLWGHSWELEEFGLWDEVESIMRIAKDYGCVPYAEVFR